MHYGYSHLFWLVRQLFDNYPDKQISCNLSLMSYVTISGWFTSRCIAELLKQVSRKVSVMPKTCKLDTFLNGRVLDNCYLINCTWIFWKNVSLIWQYILLQMMHWNIFNFLDCVRFSAELLHLSICFLGDYYVILALVYKNNVWNRKWAKLLMSY